MPERPGASSTQPPIDEADKKYEKHYPLYVWGWTREECVRVIERAGLPKPGKSSCFFCPSMKKKEIQALWEKYPDLFRRAVALEHGSAATNTSVKGLGRNWSWERYHDEFMENKAFEDAQITFDELFPDSPGGFPCQPFSKAGQRRGKSDDRYLWPEMLRVIDELRPAWVIGENVANILNLALDDVLSDLESKGYTARAFMVPARGVGAPHRRYRFAIVAHADGDGRGGAGPAPAEGRDTHQIIASMPESGLPGGGGTGNLNPEWTEWLMGFPTGWTELDASETRCARPSSSPSSNKSD